jgi:hypothetical protein
MKAVTNSLCDRFIAMIVSLLLSVILVAGATCSEAQRRARKSQKTASPPRAKEQKMGQWTEFNRLVELTGTAYEQQREHVLKNTPDLKQKLADLQANPEWQAQVLWRILQGWQDHRDLYQRVLRELEAIDVDYESKKVTGISGVWSDYAYLAKNEYGEAILPLCWEVLLKYSDVWPTWKLITFLRMQAVLPHELSVHPVLAFMDKQTDPATLDLAGRMLRYLPAQAVVPAVTAHLKEVELRAQRSAADKQQTHNLRQALQQVLKKIR